MYAPTTGQASLTERTVIAGREVLLGRRRGPLAILPFAGPAVVASIAYMDPGNFATNIQAGAKYGYELLWVALSANLIAMLFQALSAKIGIATGRNLAELCREHFPPLVVYALAGASEIAAMATELAELLGASLGLTLLCGAPLLVSMFVVGIATYAALELQRSGFRSVEILICCFVSVITRELPARAGDRTTSLERRRGWSVLAASGGSGQRYFGRWHRRRHSMPHAIYLHSGLTQARVPLVSAGAQRKALDMSNREVVLALGAAGLVNMAMIAAAAVVFHDGTHDQIAEIA